MDTQTTIKEIVGRLETFSPAQLKQVLELTLQLSSESSKRYPGEKLLELVGTISPEDSEIMKQAIEEGCEQIDASKW